MSAARNVARLRLTGQTGAIGQTGLHWAKAGALYRVAIYASISVAGSAGTVSVTLRWNDGIQAQSEVVILNLALLPLGTQGDASKVLYLGIGQSITVETSVVGLLGNPQYEVTASVEEV